MRCERHRGGRFDGSPRMLPRGAPPRTPAAAGRPRGQRGDSLVEVVVALTIVGLAFVAILSGLATLSLSAQRHNQGVLLEAALTQAKQHLATQTFSTASPPSYSMPTPTPGVTFIPVVTAVSPSLHEVKIQATNGTDIRIAIVYKGAR